MFKGLSLFHVETKQKSSYDMQDFCILRDANKDR